MAAPTTTSTAAPAPAPATPANLEQYAELKLGTDYVRGMAVVYGPNAVADLAIGIFAVDSGRPIHVFAGDALKQDMKSVHLQSVADSKKPGKEREDFLRDVETGFGRDASDKISNYYKTNDAHALQGFSEIAMARYTKHVAENSNVMDKGQHAADAFAPPADEKFAQAFGPTTAINEAMLDYAKLRDNGSVNPAFAGNADRRLEKDLGIYIKKVVADLKPGSGAGKDEIAHAKAAEAAILGSEAGEKAKRHMINIKAAIKEGKPGLAANETEQLIRDEKTFLKERAAKDAANVLTGLGITATPAPRSPTSAPPAPVVPGDPAHHGKE